MIGKTEKVIYVQFAVGKILVVGGDLHRQKVGNKMELQELVKKYLNKETPFEELANSEKHKVMWYWLSENPKLEKDNFFLKFDVKPVDSQCYACKENTERVGCCPINCPIKWLDISGNENFGCVSDGEFGRWYNTEDQKSRSILAKTIAEKEWH